MKQFLLLLLAGLLISSCASLMNHPKKDSTVNSNKEITVASKDSIVFISMKMWHDSLQQSNHIEVLEVLTKPGTLKRQLTDHGMHENYLKCITLNKTGARDSFLTEHPLYKDVEAVGENNQLSRKRLSLKEAQFFVRFQKKNYNTLVIKENAFLMPAREKEIEVIRF